MVINTALYLLELALDSPVLNPYIVFLIIFPGCDDLIMCLLAQLLLLLLLDVVVLFRSFVLVVSFHKLDLKHFPGRVGCGAGQVAQVVVAFLCRRRFVMRKLVLFSFFLMDLYLLLIGIGGI